MSEVPQHSTDFRKRRIFNWVPVGLTYASFYMGRYNYNVSRTSVSAMFSLSKAEIGTVATVGFWVYAASVMFNGPLADRFGGKKAMLLGAIGAACANLMMAAFFGLHIATKDNVILGMTVLYALNSYFQSFGALSVVKVNAPWFHTKERGVFSGLFGMMIALGYFLVYTVGEKLLGYYKEVWVIFAAPAALISLMFVVDLFLVKDKPSEAGHEDFDTGEAANADDTVNRVGPVKVTDVLKRVLTNPIILTIAAAEFCTGFVRNGLLLYFRDYLVEVKHIVPGSDLLANVGWGITIGGFVGGLIGGTLSDKLFQSRRPPVAMIYYLLQIPSLLWLQYAASPELAVALVGFNCTWIFGVHGMLSGAASVDFGGRKAAATAAGLLDGIAYIGSGLTGFALGYVIDPKHGGWGVWTWCIIPFSMMGAYLMSRLWNAQASTRPGAH
jgi:OPA family glycerol-3-phosphate transporter-like MFS transporter